MAELPALKEHEFLDLYSELVREQDKAFPVGTLSFMAPELFFAGSDGEYPYSARSDIFSLGMVSFWFFFVAADIFHWLFSLLLHVLV